MPLPRGRHPERGRSAPHRAGLVLRGPCDCNPFPQRTGGAGRCRDSHRSVGRTPRAAAGAKLSLHALPMDQSAGQLFNRKTDLTGFAPEPSLVSGINVTADDACAHASSSSLVGHLLTNRTAIRPRHQVPLVTAGQRPESPACSSGRQAYRFRNAVRAAACRQRVCEQAGNGHRPDASRYWGDRTGHP